MTKRFRTKAVRTPSVAQSALDIHTYYAARNQVTHPSVLAFKSP